MIVVSLLSVVPLTASAQSNQWGWWRTNPITDDASIDNTNSNYQGIPDEAVQVTNSGTKFTPTEGIANKGYTRAQLNELRKAIEPIPVNMVRGDCKKFEQTLKRGAYTPAGQTEYAGGVTDYAVPRVADIAWEPINPSNIVYEEVYWGILSELHYWTKLSVTAKLYNKGDIHSCGLFWTNPPEGCKASMKSF